VDLGERMLRSGKAAELRRLEPGQSLVLSTGSPIYRGAYSSRVLGLESAGVCVSIPIEEGKLVLLPVGTSVVVEAETPEGRRRFRTQVCARRTGEERCLVLEAPEQVEEEATPARGVPVWAVTSGKGGVGKTTIVVNLAIALAELGRRVCVIDGDLGTANIDVVLNLAPRYTLVDVINGQRHILEVAVEGPRGIVVLPGGSGLQELTELSEEDFERLIGQFRVLERYTDLMLIDTCSGVSRSVTNLIMAANEAILVTTPEPPAITDAYALVKVLARAGHVLPIRLLVNRARSAEEGAAVAEKMVFAAKRFLGYELQGLGNVREDDMVGRSVREQAAVLTLYPSTRAAQEIRDVARLLLGLGGGRPVPPERGGPLAFLRRLRGLARGRGGGP
jgi:flagellar biosynthesis protein FlhG